MLSMGKDGATVVDMVAEWLEDNDFDGLTDGRCHCSGRDLMHCGLVRSRRCSAAHLFPCTRCTHLTTCDRTTGADMYSTNRQRERNYALCPGDDDVRHTRWRDWERRLVMEHDIPDREISRMTGRSVRAIQVMRHKMRKNGEVRTDE